MCHVGCYVSDTLAASHRQITAYAAGEASERAAMLKHIKYQSIKAVHDFVPIAVETLGPINSEGLSFLRELGGRLSTATRDPRKTSFLFQRVLFACSGLMPLLSADPSQIFMRFPTTRG